MTRDMGLDLLTRLIKRYKLICLIITLLFLVQVFIGIRIALISSDVQSIKELGGGSSTSGSRRLKSDLDGSYDGTSQEYKTRTDRHNYSPVVQRNRAEKDPEVPDLLDEKDSSEHVKLDKETVQSQSQQLKQSKENSSRLPELDLQSLDFMPECQITNKESISAIQRAKTQECKKQLAKISCQEVLYPAKLPRYCKSAENIYMRHNGCYQDEQKNRILPDHVALLKLTNSPQNCVELCLQSGYAFAGVQYSIECFCGNKRPSDDLRLSLDECNMKCPTFNRSSNGGVSMRNQSRICGGYFTMNVYETGVFNLSGGNDVKGLEDINRALLDTSSGPKARARIVFFLTLNGRAVRQVIRLIKTLFRSQHYFYIHVDARQDYLFRELQILKTKIPDNIHFMKSREATIWGGASLLTVLLNGMKDLIDNSSSWGWSWDYVINLSESDFPLKTIEQLETFLALNNGKNFLKSHGRDVMKFITKQGLDRTFVECEYRMWRLQDRKLPAGIVFDGGSDWIALHRDFINYIVSTDDELVTGLRLIFKNTLLPAESFFHTVLRNSEFCESFVDNNLHVTNWKRKLGCKCQYKSVVDWCGCSPNDFRLADWSRLELADARLIFFGRKFESIVNQAIINKLEAKLQPNAHEYAELPTQDKYWQNIYHHRDRSPKPQDTILTLGHSLARISTGTFLKSFAGPGAPSYKPMDLVVNVEEMHIFAQNDQIEGILVKFEAHLPNNVNLKLESWFKLQQGLVDFEDDSKLGKYAGKVQNFRIGEDYDAKEQIFRNYAGILGPNSEPVLAYNVYADEAFNISFVWMNPSNRVTNTINVVVNPADVANYVKPTVRGGLPTGNWTVRVQTPSKHLIASVKFLISPLEFVNGERVGVSTFKDQQQQQYKTLEELQSTIDSQIGTYYELQDLCFVKPISQVLLATMHGNGVHEKAEAGSNFGSPQFEAEACTSTSWSSLYPDPKGEIVSIDPATGLLLP